jgi:hypothetical protein
MESAEHNKFEDAAAQRAATLAKSGGLRDSTVVALLENVSDDQIHQNRAVLKKIIAALLLLGKNNWALRGDDDDSGGFRSLLEYNARHGSAMQHHLDYAKRNDLYTSATFQNEFLNIIGGNILQKLVARIKRSGFFTVLADETADVSTIKQMNLCIRHVNMEVGGKVYVYEDFVANNEHNRRDAGLNHTLQGG